MKKLLLVALAILLVAGVAHAQIITGETDGPFRRLIGVRNSGATALDAGDVVVWEISDSTGDNDAYVQATTTADTFLVAGVMLSAAGIDDQGIMITWGIADVDTASSGTIMEGSLLCTSTTTGAVDTCSEAASDSEAVGFATVAESGGSVTAFVNP